MPLEPGVTRALQIHFVGELCVCFSEVYLILLFITVLLSEFCAINLFAKSIGYYILVKERSIQFCVGGAY